MSVDQSQTLPPAAAEDAPESALCGPYRLERELGRGGSSVVYAAYDPARRRAVALKVLTVSAALDEARRQDLQERFRREAQAVSSLSHPNIVTLYEVGECRRAEAVRPYIAMERLPGETLRRRIDQAAPLSVPVTVALGVQIAEALDYAHRRGIVHRDVKPDNIFLARDGAGPPIPKLMDFGIAHLLAAQALTQDGAILGSPAYMSPEQIHGLTPDARTDVFSLAVTLAEMATGVKPFAADTIPALMQKILHQPPDLHAVADRRLRRVLGKALAKNPAGRYPDAGAFAGALRRAAPRGLPAPSFATQHFDPAVRAAALVGGRRAASRLNLPRPAWAGLGVLALAAASLPFWAGHPPPAALRTASAAPRPAPPALSPPLFLPRAATVPVRRAALVEAPPQAPRRAASAPPYRPDAEKIVVRIAEGQPRRAALPLPVAALAAAPSRTVRPVVRYAQAHPAMARPARLSMPLPDGPPRPLKRTLPQAADGLDHAGVVARVRLSVDEQGDVSEAYILRSSGSRTLDAAVLDAVGRWRYAPARQNGRPVSGTAFDTVAFGAADAPPTRVPGRMSLPAPLSRPLPPLPDGEDRADAAARVRLRVDEHGEVSEAYILRSSGSRTLDAAVLDAVGHWQYAPALQDGKPVSSTTVETVQFAP